MEILALQLKRIGDLILTTPALDWLRERYPEARLTVVIDETSAGLSPGLRQADRVWIYRRRRPNVGLWLRLMAGRWNLAFDFTGNDRSSIMTVLSKACRRRAFERVRKTRHRAWCYNEFVDSSVRERHTVDHHLDLVADRVLEDGVDETPPGPRLELPASALKQADQVLTQLELAPPFAVVHPGTARPEKYWSAEGWARVIEYLRETKGMEVLLTGGPDTLEREHADQIQNKMTTPCLELMGKMDLLTLTELIRRAGLFLGVDSAPMHLAACVRAPTVVLFGPTNPFHWRPRHPETRVLVPETSEPLERFEPHRPRGEMSGILPESVISAVESLRRTSA